jgi:hypothetical protein
MNEQFEKWFDEVFFNDHRPQENYYSTIKELLQWAFEGGQKWQESTKTD